MDKIINKLFGPSKKVDVQPSVKPDVTDGAKNITKMLVPKINPVTRSLYLGNNEKRAKPNLDHLKDLTMPNFKKGRLF